MGGISRSQGRAACGKIQKLFAYDAATARVIRFVTARMAAQRVAEGKWREVFYEDDGSFAGYQPAAPETLRPVKVAGPKGSHRVPLAETITVTEMRMNAGEFGESHTLGMPEWRRERYQRRVREEDRKIVPLEDAIERAHEKVRLWPYPANRVGTAEDGSPIFGDRAVRVYPRTK